MSAWLKLLNPKVAKKVKSVLVKDKAGTITGVTPMSGKVPWYIGAGGKDPGKRAKIVKTSVHVKRSDKIDKLEKQVKEGKEGLKHMEATGHAKEFKDYKDKPTGKYFRTGSR